MYVSAGRAVIVPFGGREADGVAVELSPGVPFSAVLGPGYALVAPRGSAGPGEAVKVTGGECKP